VGSASTHSALASIQKTELYCSNAPRCPRAYWTSSAAIPNFILALKALTPRSLFRTVAAWEVTVSLMLLATTVSCRSPACLDEARFRSKTGTETPLTVAVSRLVFVLMTKL
jgi:hypothetical protein